MQVRSPNPDESGDDDADDGPDDGTDADVADDAFDPDLDEPRDPEADRARYLAQLGPDGSITFRVRSGVITAKFAVAAGFLAVGLFLGIGAELILGLAAGIGMGLYGLRDVLGRDRLRADRAGLRIATGFGHRRTLAWSAVERLRLDERNRLGTRSELLEIDAGEELYLFSRFDLGAAPSDALAMLDAIRTTLS